MPLQVVGAPAAAVATSSDAVIEDCRFQSNTARGFGQFASGGAVKNNFGSVTITRCTFISNIHNNYGGAIDNREGTIDVADCIFDLNDATYGAGVRSGAGQATVTRCQFLEGNLANIGAGAYFVGGTHLVSKCLFQGMHAFDGGGGVSLSANASCTIVNCGFFGNVATTFFGGGAIWNGFTNLTGTLTIVNCVFSGNQSTAWVRPPGIRGGAILNDSQGPTLIANCTFANNTLPAGAPGGAASSA